MQIKFKAWDEDMREMVRVSEIHFDKVPGDIHREKPFILDERNDVRELDDIKLLQFTGEYDRNNNEIYEGDILRPYIGDGVIIVRDLKRFYIETVNIELRNYEIIDNIYED